MTRLASSWVSKSFDLSFSSLPIFGGLTSFSDSIGTSHDPSYLYQNLYYLKSIDRHFDQFSFDQNSGVDRYHFLQFTLNCSDDFSHLSLSAHGFTYSNYYIIYVEQGLNF